MMSVTTPPMPFSAACAEAITIPAAGRADKTHPAFRLRNREDDNGPRWMDLGPIGASPTLFFLRTDRCELFAGAAPQLLGALAAGAPLTRYVHDFAYVVDDSKDKDEEARKGVVFSVTVVGSQGCVVEFKALEAFELPPPMRLDESLALLARP